MWHSNNQMFALKTKHKPVILHITQNMSGILNTTTQKLTLTLNTTNNL